MPGDAYGNFSPGDAILYNGNFSTPSYRSGSSPITFTFANGLNGVGTQIQDAFYGTFTAQIQAFDKSGHSLGVFTEDGISNGNNDGSAIFLGIKGTSAPIYQVTYSITSVQNGGANDIAINRLQLNTAPVPEASSCVSFGVLALFGSAGLALMARKRKAGASA